MFSAILLTINLAGALEGVVKHTNMQKSTVDISPIGSRHPDWFTANICHTDRKPVPCYRKVTIPANVVNEWAKSECPRWRKPSEWKTKTPAQKIESHLSQYDEGFGILYDFFD